jgi:hypothetical protein
MRRVILESPYQDNIDGNVVYARRCICDCLKRGESPIASHLLFTQPGILRDNIPEERALGIAAGMAWATVADAMVIYIDRGMSDGMRDAIREAQRTGLLVELRCLEAVEMGAA